MMNLNISEIVQNIRKKMGLSQEALARKLGISFSSVNAWERGKREPHPYWSKRLQQLERKIKKN